MVALDVDDVRLSARKGVLRIFGKGERVREVPIHPKLAKSLKGWLELDEEERNELEEMLRSLGFDPSPLVLAPPYVVGEP